MSHHTPWDLKGFGYLFFLKPSVLDKLRPSPGLTALKRTRMPVLGIFHYDESPVGPYSECLFIPGSVTYNRQKSLSVSHIMVDSAESKQQGRAEWGLPKEMATFQWMTTDDSQRMKVIYPKGQIRAEASARPFGITVPNFLIPSSMKRYLQPYQHEYYLSHAQLKAKIHPATLTLLEVDHPQLPRIRTEDVKYTLMLDKLHLQMGKGERV